MDDFERYGDYNEYDDDSTGKKTNIVGLLLKLIIALACISVARATAWHTASEVIEPIVNTPLSIASGRSVDVRTETAGK